MLNITKIFLTRKDLHDILIYVLISEREKFSVTGVKAVKSEKVSDEELVRAAKSGDDKAWEEIFFRYRNLVSPKKETKFLIGAEESDVIQERLLGLYSAVTDFDETRNTRFSAFAKRCVNNRLSTAITASLRKKHSPLNSYVSLDKETDEEEGGIPLLNLITANNARNPEDILIDRENKYDMEYKINKELSSLEIKVLAKYLEGWSYREIAEGLGKDEKSVDNAMQRIKRRFKNRRDIMDSAKQTY